MSIALESASAQPLSIQAACGGNLSAPMAQIAKPYQQAVAALRGTEAGWCAMAAEQDANTPESAAMWELVSAAYVLHALRGRKNITPAQQGALQSVLAQVPGMGKPPARLRDIDTAIYVHARTLAAADGSAAQVALDGMQQHAPAIYRTLMRRSVRWGDADDN
jgi:hypothetical protein